jgi:hypothetical protein
MRRDPVTAISVSPELRRLLIHCETNCTAACCRSAAFETTRHVLRQWIDAERIDRTESILLELSQLLEKIEGLQANLRFEIRHLESEWDQSEALVFFSNLREVFDETVNRNTV